MTLSYDLHGYDIRYFNGEQDLHALTKRINKFVKINPNLDFQGIDVQWQGEEIGWTAYIIYMGTANEV